MRLPDSKIRPPSGSQLLLAALLTSFVIESHMCSAGSGRATAAPASASRTPSRDDRTEEGSRVRREERGAQISENELPPEAVKSMTASHSQGGGCEYEKGHWGQCGQDG